MSGKTEDQLDAQKAPLSDAVLRRIVGGTRPEEAQPLDAERAIALTVGLEAPAEAAAFIDPGKLPAARLDAAPPGVEVAIKVPLAAPGGEALIKVGVTPAADPAPNGGEGRFEVAVTVPTAGGVADGVVKIDATPTEHPAPVAWHDPAVPPGFDKSAASGEATDLSRSHDVNDDPRLAPFRDITGDGLQAGRHLHEWQKEAEAEHHFGLEPRGEAATALATATGSGGHGTPAPHDVAAYNGMVAAHNEVVAAHDNLAKVQHGVAQDRAESHGPADRLLGEARALHAITAETVATTQAQAQQAKLLGHPDAAVREAAHDEAVKNHEASIRHLEAIHEMVDQHKDSVEHRGNEKVEAARDQVEHAEIELAKQLNQADLAAAQRAQEAEKAEERAAEIRRGTAAFVNKAASEILNEAARADAKAHDGYSNTIEEVNTSGYGIVTTKTALEDGGLRTQHSLAQTTETSGSESWSSELGSGGRIVQAVKAEAGEHVVTEHRDEDGNLISATSTKTYASAGVAGEASFSINAAGIYAEASIKAEAHAEAGASGSVGVLGAEVTGTATAAAHAVAGAEAGFHLGFDGLVATAEAKAEVSVSATGSVDVKVDGVTVTVGATVFAEARAEAQAEAVVNFDPTKGVVQAKFGASAEASIGVGADVTGGTFTDDGHGVGATAHFKAGAIGVKFKPDISIHDGEVDIKLGIGGYLGVGASFDIEVKGNYQKAYENIQKANEVLAENPVLAVAFAPAVVTYYVWSAFSGFFS